MEIDDKERRAFLKDEYLFLQGQYEDFDRRSITIKGWMASGSFLGLVFSLKEAGLVYLYIHASLIIVSLMVWYLEAKWKLFQYALADRIRVIEAYFRGDQDIFIKNPDPFQIYNSWFRSYAQDEPIYEYERNRRDRSENRPRNPMRRLIRVALQTFVHLPYSIIVILSLLGLALHFLLPPSELPKSAAQNTVDSKFYLGTA
ncbi:hypothetical protein [Rhizobium sp. C4]|uniref:hypothetical protein n=1 Tax=Rhizobium sp. C4 TaxID=1349800 RepID=UPI001E3D742F|nr:hypothetical protein [Rhizobium sp. C4]MCD2173009.1 hypothetical protein [Rhizobium sp. C4]